MPGGLIRGTIRMTTGQPAVFLDRDGVLNEVVARDGVTHPPDRLEEFVFLPGVPAAVRRLHDANQPERHILAATRPALIGTAPVQAMITALQAVAGSARSLSGTDGGYRVQPRLSLRHDRLSPGGVSSMSVTCSGPPHLCTERTPANLLRTHRPQYRTLV